MDFTPVVNIILGGLGVTGIVGIFKIYFVVIRIEEKIKGHITLDDERFKEIDKTLVSLKERLSGN